MLVECEYAYVQLVSLGLVNTLFKEVFESSKFMVPLSTAFAARELHNAQTPDKYQHVAKGL